MSTEICVHLSLYCTSEFFRESVTTSSAASQGTPPPRPKNARDRYARKQFPSPPHCSLVVVCQVDEMAEKTVLTRQQETVVKKMWLDSKTKQLASVEDAQYAERSLGVLGLISNLPLTASVAVAAVAFAAQLLRCSKTSTRCSGDELLWAFEIALGFVVLPGICWTIVKSKRWEERALEYRKSAAFHGSVVEKIEDMAKEGNWSSTRMAELRSARDKAITTSATPNSTTAMSRAIGVVVKQKLGMLLQGEQEVVACVSSITEIPELLSQPLNSLLIKERDE